MHTSARQLPVDGVPGRPAVPARPVVAAAEVVAASTVARCLDRVQGSGHEVDVVAPATQEVVGRLREATPADVLEAASLARTVQPAWHAIGVRRRAATVLRLHDELVERADEITSLVQLVAGKSRKDAYVEVVAVQQITRYYARRAVWMLRPGRRSGLLPGLTAARVERVPAGVVGNVTAWNYPLLFVLGDAVAALVAGNVVLTKPHVRSAPLAGAVAGLLTDAGVPPGAFAVLASDDRAVAEAVVDASDHVMFTGSEAVGRAVAARAGSRLVGVTLELGGKNALYVAADADVARAAESAVRDCFAGTGQTCTSTERLFVHRDVAEEFTAHFLRRVGRLRLGWDAGWVADVGALVSPAQLERVLAHVEDAVSLGATVLAGGRARPDLGPTFVEPTVLSGVPPHARCAHEETFGPLVSMYVVDDDDDAVRRIRESPTGLMASVWSQDGARARRIASQLRVGTVLVNETYFTAWGSVAAPLGGLGTSGVGRRYGVEGLLETTRTRVVLTQHTPLVSWLVDRPAEHWSGWVRHGLRVARRVGLP